MASPATILYFHGGGYTFNATISHWFTDLIAAKTGAKTFAVNYRLTPENPHPAQLDDALLAYQYLLDSGVKPENLVVMGDSAGGIWR